MFWGYLQVSDNWTVSRWPGNISQWVSSLPPSSQAITALRPSLAWLGKALNSALLLTDPFSHNIIRKDVVEEELMIVDSVEEYRIESLYCNIALVLFGSNRSLPPASVRLLLTLTQSEERLSECRMVVILVVWAEGRGEVGAKKDDSKKRGGASHSLFGES